MKIKKALCFLGSLFLVPLAVIIYLILWPMVLVENAINARRKRHGKPPKIFFHFN